MKKKIIILGLCLLLVAGCGRRIPTLQNGEEAIIEFKNGKMVSVDAFYERLKNDMGLQTLITMMDKVILEKVYKSDVKDAKESATRAVQSVEAQYGDEALADIVVYPFTKKRWDF